jgi:spore germination cell wall hydrolase CwlJ-like protein
MQIKHRIWVWACVVVVVLSGCQPNEVDRAPKPEATGPEVTERKVEALEQNASAGGDMAAPSASETIKKAEAQAVDPVGTDPMDDAITCLARSIYWEARGEEAVSMEAVANVVMNRLGHEGFPNTVCEVVMQGHERGACQFSWWCDGRSDQAKEDESYAIAKEVARRALNLQLTDRTGGALYFHHRNVTPSWATEYIKTVEIGEFVFYKPHGGDAR